MPLRLRSMQSERAPSCRRRPHSRSVRAVGRKLAYHFEEGGLGGIVRRLRHYLREKCWSEQRWLIYKCDGTFTTGDVSEPVSRRRLDFQELLKLSYVKARAFPEGIRQRYERGEVCEGFFVKDDLATLGWVSRGYLELDVGTTLSLGGAAGLYDFVTLERYRGRGFYTSALRQLLRLLGNEGMAAIYIAVDPGNVASIRGIERAGFKLERHIYRRWRFGMAEVVEERVSGL